MPNPLLRYFTSESVTEGHPDKIADQISDAVLDAILRQDPAARVAVETFLTGSHVILGGEVSTTAKVDYEAIARETIARIGYDDVSKGLDFRICSVDVHIGEQSPEIFNGVFKSAKSLEERFATQGAGDQGIMFGFASNETRTRMPVAITIAHHLAWKLTEVRKSGVVPYLRPDGKTQVTVGYHGIIPIEVSTVLISTQHDDGIDNDRIKGDVWEYVVLPVLAEYADLDVSNVILHVNPSGSFVLGGPAGDAGLTGRKIIVDTYGGAARHGGGAFSGKDPSKVDRSAAYAMRWVAKSIVDAGLAAQVEVQVAYAIGRAEPLAVYLNTYGTGTVEDDVIAEAVRTVFDLRPAALIHNLKLLDASVVRYESTASYGHFGLVPGHDTASSRPWENTQETAAALRVAVGLNR